MRFCQVDGTPLIDDAPPPDPYKTMVASKEDIRSALNAEPERPLASASIGQPEDEPLELPAEPIAATPASEFETKIAGRDDAQVIEIPPLAESTPPEPPRFNEPSAPPSPFANSTPASPFSSKQSGGAGDFPTTPPIPSPFNEPKSPPFDTPSAPRPPEPEPIEPAYFDPEPSPAFVEPDPIPVKPEYIEPERPAAQSFNPFEKQSVSPPAPPAARSEWQMQTPGQGGTGMSQPPPAAAGPKLNQTLPIVSLVAGIISLCCYVSPVTGLVTLITGFLGMKNANNMPNQYGGKTLAIIGMVLGGLMFLVGIAYYIFFLFFGGMGMMMQLLNQR